MCILRFTALAKAPQGDFPHDLKHCGLLPAMRSESLPYAVPWAVYNQALNANDESTHSKQDRRVQNSIIYSNGIARKTL